MSQLRYTMEQRLFLVQLYFKYESAGKICGIFRCQFPGRPIPSKQTWSLNWKQQDRCYTKSPTGHEMYWEKRNWKLFVLDLKLPQENLLND